MTNHTKNKLAPWQFLLLFIASFGILTGLGNLTTVQTFLSANIAQAQESEASVKQKLIGRWRVTENRQGMDMIFTPEGKIFMLVTSDDRFDETKYKDEAMYKIDMSFTPNRLYFLTDNRVVRSLEFEFADQKLIIHDRPERPVTTVFEKISSETKLTNLENSRVSSLQAARESEAKSFIGAINRGQQAFHFENVRFANANPMNKSNELGVQMQSNYYNFKTSANKNNAISIATPKQPNKYKLRNYAGMISYSNKLYYPIICVSNEIGGKVVPTFKNGKAYCAVGKEVK